MEVLKMNEHLIKLEKENFYLKDQMKAMENKKEVFCELDSI